MKQKIILTLVLLLSAVLLACITAAPRVSAATYSTKIECATIVSTITATADNALTTNAPFTVSGITSTSTAPGGITVSKIVSTSSVSNASPSVVTGVWTGAATGTFTVNFPDITLTATGAAGSQAKLSLTSIALYINGNTTTPIVTCTQGNGQLTANKPGESLTLFNIGIVAPAPVTTPTQPTTTTKSTSPVPATKTTTPTKPSTPTNTTTAPAQPTPASTLTAETAKTKSQANVVTITVLDSSGKPLSNVQVIIDDNKPVMTSSSGTVSIPGLSEGEHTVAVLGKQSKVTRTITVSGKNEPVQLTVKMPRQGLPLATILGAGALLLGVIVAILSALIRHRRRKATLAHILPTATNTLPVASPTLTNAVPVSFLAPQPNTTTYTPQHQPGNIITPQTPTQA